MIDGRTQRLRDGLDDAIRMVESELSAVHFTEELATNGSKPLKAKLQDIALAMGIAMADTHIHMYIHACRHHMISHATSLDFIQLLGCAVFRYGSVCCCHSLCVGVCLFICYARL